MGKIQIKKISGLGGDGGEEEELKKLDLYSAYYIYQKIMIKNN